MLMALGIVTCTELYQHRALLSLLFSETSWHYFLHIALGLGSTDLARYLYRVIQPFVVSIIIYQCQFEPLR